MEWRNAGTLLRGYLLDVSGHGLATALQTASFGVLLREAATSKLSLLGQMKRINARAAKCFAEGSYAAMLGFELDLTMGELRYVGAGVTQFFANGRKIETPGMFVGMWDDPKFSMDTLSISPGDTFHFLTDGFTDALLQPENQSCWSPDGIDFDADVASLVRLAESGTLRDDATGICVKIKGQEGSR
jgi:serine phosphatase RsbU (regulator of sigma subunit)